MIQKRKISGIVAIQYLLGQSSILVPCLEMILAYFLA
jgi:hypothetical protein